MKTDAIDESNEPFIIVLHQKFPFKTILASGNGAADKT